MNDAETQIKWSVERHFISDEYGYFLLYKAEDGEHMLRHHDGVLQLVTEIPAPLIRMPFNFSKVVK